MKKSTLYNLELNLIQADPNQPRKVMDAQSLDELAVTVQKHGVLEPILFRVAPDGDKKRTIDYRILENDQALNVAIQDFKNNWNVYIEKRNKWRDENTLTWGSQTLNNGLING
jgi:hypothetical protein